MESLLGLYNFVLHSLHHTLNVFVRLQSSKPLPAYTKDSFLYFRIKGLNFFIINPQESENSMEKEIIHNKQGISIMVMFTIGSLIIIGQRLPAKQDIWISIIIAFFISLPIIFIDSKILSLFPGKDLYDILLEVFGKVTGRIIAALYTWYSFHLGALVIKTFSAFVNVISFPETPEQIIVIFLGVLCVFTVKAGIEVIARFSRFILPVVLAILFVTIVISMSQANFTNLKPILYYGIKPILLSSFGVFALPLGEAIIFTLIFGSLKNSRESFKVFFISTGIGSLLILAVAVRNITILGIPLSSSLYFPSYAAVRTLHIGEILQRFEVVVAVVFIFGGFAKTCVCLYASSLGLSKILNIENYRSLVGALGLLMMSFSCVVFENTIEAFTWAYKAYPFYVLPFQVIMPIIILIAAKIKLRKQQQNKPGTGEA